MTRECDHCDEATAEVMSLIDHEFTGAEVRALNAHFAALQAEVDRLRAVIVAEVAENDMLKGHIPSNFGIGSGVGPQSVDEIVVFAEQRLRINRECAYWLVEREVADAKVDVHLLWGGSWCLEEIGLGSTRAVCEPSLLKAIDKLKESP